MHEHHLELPDGMRTKLETFRRRVWMVKLAEGLLAGVFGLLLSYLLVFCLDRFWDTPMLLRWSILIGGSVALGVLFPLKCHRWIWRNRRLAQVARLLRYKFPRLGDQLLGIVELADSESEQVRSQALVRAAMRQVDHAARDHDFNDAVPYPRHRRWALAVVVPLLLAGLALVLVPAAGRNALARWLMPWRNTPRYTFAQLQELPDRLVVPYAEEFLFSASLAPDTAWSPASGSAQYNRQNRVQAKLQDGRYAFNLPPQQDPGSLTVAIGDARKRVRVEPTVRPELTSLVALVELPEYLKRQAGLRQDVRGGVLTLVKGSKAVLRASASRELAHATVNGRPAVVDGQQLTTPPFSVSESTTREFIWQDALGLSAKQPFVLRIESREDDPPVLMCNKINDGQVVLEGEVLSFDIRVEDDFGVREIGLEWVGLEDAFRNPHPAKGEKIISAGDPETGSVEVVAAFSAKREGIKPQTLQVRAYAIDYLPDRQRVYSPVYTLHVLSAEEHAIWLTQRFRKWFRQSQEVYEREQQLHDVNKELRKLPADETDKPENRRRIEAQAAAEQANGRRLTALTGAGKELIEQAARNDQFNVATLEQWATMLAALQDIAGNRMPSVADLLKEAADAPGQGQPGTGKPGTGKPGAGKPGTGKPGQGKPGQGKPGEGQPGQGEPGDGKPSEAEPGEGQGETPPMVGENRDPKSSPGGKTEPGPPNKVPGIGDTESSFNDDDDKDSKDDPPSKSGPGKLTLPGTTIRGGGPPQPDQDDAAPTPAQEKLDDAIEEQKDLLAEFAKVAEELQKILGNLEGSTFVKRLKSASRRQMEVAGDLNNSLKGAFGVDKREVGDDKQEQGRKIAERELAQSESVYTIQEDLEAYYNRVQEGKFRGVLNEMKEASVVSQLKNIGDTVQGNLNGQSIAEAEFWADALDRWAEQLVGPG